MGSAVEWYDYGVYGYLAATIGVNFFPSEDPAVSLMASFATFAVAFVIRPAGGILFGHLGDRFGRRPAFVWTVALISAATMAVAFLPTYATIGIAAPILLVLMRLLQGLSAGGEVPAANTYVLEHAPGGRRGIYVSWISVGSFGGFILAISTVTLCSVLLGDATMDSWGWRIPFAVAGPLGLISMYIRRRLDESPAFEVLKAEERRPIAPVSSVLTHHRSKVVQVAGLVTLHNVMYYFTLTYVFTYMSTELEISKGVAQASSIVVCLSATASILTFSLLSDRVGRRPVILGAAVVTGVLAYPLLVLMGFGNEFIAIAAHSVFGVLLGAIMGGTLSVYGELFPSSVRVSGYSLSYNIPTALFAGTAPFVSTWLIDASGNVLAPSYYLFFVVVVGILAALSIRETSGRPFPAEERVAVP